MKGVGCPNKIATASPISVHDGARHMYPVSVIANRRPRLAVIIWRINVYTCSSASWNLTLLDTGSTLSVSGVPSPPVAARNVAPTSSIAVLNRIAVVPAHRSSTSRVRAKASSMFSYKRASLSSRHVRAESNQASHD